jgi:hypothetical protein
MDYLAIAAADALTNRHFAVDHETFARLGERSCDRKADCACAHNNRVYTIHFATRFRLLPDVF